jgi:hypothetical protein
MDLLALNSTPLTGSISVPLDTKIELEFNQPIDPFTVQNGIVLYTLTSGLWTGPELSILDNQWSDVLDTSGEYTYYPYNFTIEGNKVKITPSISLAADKKYYLTVLPGDNPLRYLSKSTISAFTKSSSGAVNALSSYTGSTSATYAITIASSGTLDVLKNGAYLGLFNYIINQPINLGDITISLNGTWRHDDTISFECYKAEGTKSILKVDFTTSKYATTTPTSTIIHTLSDSTIPLRVMSTIPDHESVNNTKCNPIVIRFNKELSPDQDVSRYINIRRYDIDDGKSVPLNYYCNITGDTLKVYLTTAGA